MTVTVDYQTAHNILITQGTDAAQHPDSLLQCLSQGKPPIPGQVTTILLALKVLFEGLREATQLDRELAAALFILATQSRQYFDAGDRAGIEWTPLLNDDLDRIARAVHSIFQGEWLES